jgi:hypothetical protein
MTVALRMVIPLHVLDLLHSTIVYHSTGRLNIEDLMISPNRVKVGLITIVVEVLNYLDSYYSGARWLLL